MDRSQVTINYPFLVADCLGNQHFKGFCYVKLQSRSMNVQYPVMTCVDNYQKHFLIQLLLHVKAWLSKLLVQTINRTHCFRVLP